MRFIRTYAILTTCLTALCACSTSRNTAGTRFYHSMTAKYNVWHNGNEAYKEGYGQQEEAVKDNYLRILPVFITSDSNLVKKGTQNFDLAIEKAQKGIKLHSISTPPKKKPGKNLTQKEKEYRTHKEFNPFMWKLWFLMADAQQQKGEFLEAAGTYNYIARLFSFDKKISTRALIDMGKCYSLLNWDYEAEQVFSSCYSDSIPLSMRSYYDIVLGAHLLKQERYKESLPLIENGINRNNKTKTEKYREYYILGQLYSQNGQYDKAYRYFGKVVRKNPPYITDLSARIAQTENITSGGSSTLKKLHRLEKKATNADYLDRINYAIGNVYIANADTASALKYWEKATTLGSEKNSPEKGILYLRLADIYWNRLDYKNAGRCYSAAVGQIDIKHADYQTIKKRSDYLDHLSTYLESIVEQDSLLYLSTQEISQIETVINQAIERDYASRQALQQASSKEQARKQANSDNNGLWYFYNPSLVEYGKEQFLEQWGFRKDQDDWRRGIQASTDNVIENQEEKPAQDTLLAQISGDTLAYWERIPFKPEQKIQCRNILTASLLGAGLIYKDDLNEYNLADSLLTRLAFGFPDARENLEAYYNLFLMHSLNGDEQMASVYKDSMISRYPESKLTMEISSPDFVENAIYGKHREDSLYVRTYEAYKQGEIDTVLQNCDKSQKLYPAGIHRAKFLFLEALTSLDNQDTNAFLEKLRFIISNYPDNEISQLSQIISTGIEEGKIMQSTSVSQLWERKFGEQNDTSANRKDIFSAERLDTFVCIIAFPSESVNRNQLLFEVAKYNFSNFMVRNFDITPSEYDRIGMLQIGPFINFDEAFLYRKRLFSNGEMAQKLKGFEVILISQSNLDILLKESSFTEYQNFYNQNFLKIPEPDIDGTTIFEELN